MSMRTNRRTRGKFHVNFDTRFKLRQDVEEEALRRARMAINRGFDNWQDLDDHESKEISLSERYLVRMDHFYDDYGTVYVDLYDFRSGEPPVTIAEIKI